MFLAEVFFWNTRIRSHSCFEEPSSRKSVKSGELLLAAERNEEVRSILVKNGEVKKFSNL